MIIFFALLLATLGVILALWAHYELAVLRRDLKALLESFQEIQRGVEAAVGASGARSKREFTGQEPRSRPGGTPG